MDSLKDALTMQHLIASLERAARDETHSIMGMLELVAEGPLTESQQEQLRSCGSSADRLLRSVQNVYEFACPETAKPQMSEIDLQELVADTAGLVRELAWHKGLSFTARVRSGTPARVTGDRHRIENILVRLIDNAIKFTDEGWIRLIVARREDDPATGRIEFIVCDSGRGIPKETIARVMDPAAPDHLADGLGLPIVHQFVLGMGGELSIIRLDGGGTQVTVSLPLKISDACGGPVLNEVNLTRDHFMESLRPLKILVAEDSDQSYYVIESYLGGQAHQLTRAQNGADALAGCGKTESAR